MGICIGALVDVAPTHTDMRYVHTQLYTYNYIHTAHTHTHTYDKTSQYDARELSAPKSQSMNGKHSSDTQFPMRMITFGIQKLQLISTN